MPELFSFFCSLFFIVGCFLCALFLILYVRRLYLRRLFRRSIVVRRTSPVSIGVVLGSGGHTMEMLRLLDNLSSDYYTPRFYLLADTDTTSLARLEISESKMKNGVDQIFRIPRSREVRQNYISSIMSTLISMLRCAPLIFFNLKSIDILLCNGPGTCVPVCFFVYLYNLIFFRRCQIIFVESLCRVENLSTTGLLLYYLGIADEIFVQWPQLAKKYKRSTYLGRLV